MVSCTVSELYINKTVIEKINKKDVIPSRLRYAVTFKKVVFQVIEVFQTI